METQHGLNLQRSRLERAAGYTTAHSHTSTNTTLTYSTSPNTTTAANSTASSTSVTYDTTANTPVNTTTTNRYCKPKHSCKHKANLPTLSEAEARLQTHSHPHAEIQPRPHVQETQQSQSTAGMRRHTEEVRDVCLFQPRGSRRLKTVITTEPDHPSVFQTA